MTRSRAAIRLLLLAAVGASGCGDDTVGQDGSTPSDSGGSRDVALPSDAARQTDASVPSDASPPGDASGSNDSAVPADASAPRDLSVLADASAPRDLSVLADLSAPRDLSVLADLSAPRDLAAADLASNRNPCASNGAPPATYQHVVIFSFENRTWGDVRLGFDPVTMPYLHSLASQCTYFSDWSETNLNQNSLTQYIGETSGVDNPKTVNDCSPSNTCRSTDDNIFRQVRVAGGTARNFVEGAANGCSAAGNAPKHIPALYYFGSYVDPISGMTVTDDSFCNTEVRPYSEFDPNNLPTYAFISPTLCNDGHDCGDATVNAWAAINVQRVLDSPAYQAGTTAVFIWYDEDHPTPNIQIAPTAHKGDILQVGVGSHAALMKTIEDMLGLPILTQGQLQAATDLRSLTGL
jgi:hypothetical protein